MDAASAGGHDEVPPRWPVFLRYGDHEEVCVGDVHATTSPELLTSMADLLRGIANMLEDRVHDV